MHRFASGETDIERDTRLAIDAEVRASPKLIRTRPTNDPHCTPAEQRSV